MYLRLQLHGDEDTAYMASVTKPVMKVVHVPAGTSVDEVMTHPAMAEPGHACAVLLVSSHPPPPNSCASDERPETIVGLGFRTRRWEGLRRAARVRPSIGRSPRRSRRVASRCSSPGVRLSRRFAPRAPSEDVCKMRKQG